MLTLPKLLLIALIVFAIFGAGKLPAAMRDLGKSLRSLKEGFSGDDDTAAKPVEPQTRLEAKTDARQIDQDPHI